MKNSQLINRAILTIITLISIGIVTLILYIFIPLDVPKHRVVLPKGSVTNTINYLKREGFKLSPIDIYLLVLIGEPKQGELFIEENKINRIDFLRKLTNSVTGEFDVVTLIPGETKTIFFKNLAEKYGFNYKNLDGNYTKQSFYPDAGIFPDTYHIPKEIKEDKLISFLVKSTEKRYRKLALKELGRYDREEWILFLTIASIIQKEAGSVEEMPKISSVIYNRLIKGMPLQMDGTLNYGEYSHVRVTPKRIREDRSLFNTYINRGIPPQPICAVSMDAINSALHPEESNYLFFMKNGEGVHDFSTTYEEHLKNIAKSKGK